MLGQFLLAFGKFVITHHLVVLLVIVSMVSLQRGDTSLAHKYTKKLNMLMWLLFGSAMLSALEHVIGDLENATQATILVRKILMNVGYVTRPILLLLAFRFLNPNDTRKWTLWIPAILNGLLYLINFTPWYFVTISPDNHWMLTTGGFRFLYGASYATALFYAVFLTIFAIWSLRHQRDHEGKLIIFNLVAILVGTLIESEWDVYDLGYQVGAISLYSMHNYLVLRQAKRDPLTGLLNRQSYYRDIEWYGKSLKAILSIDMNGLKYLNDHFGHSAGDEALTVVGQELANASRIKGVYAYRVGGDEFMILCHGNIRAEDVCRDVQKRINEGTSYRVAIGMAIREPGEDIQTLTVRADALMYAEKKRMKAEGLDGVDADIVI